MAKKNIVVLDGFTLNPGDLSWDALSALGNLKVYERTSPNEIISRAKEADVILTNKTPLTSQAIIELPKLKYIGVLATGYNVVDINALVDMGIILTNVPAYGTDSVAQMVFAHILNLSQHVAHHNTTVKSGRWSNSKDWCYWDFPLMELKDKTIGIIGYGNIGQKVAEIALAFGMKILTSTVQKIDEDNLPLKVCDLKTLLRESDFVTLHCPLTTETQNLINSESISLMKKSAFLINTSRGPLINESDLADALINDRLAGAGLDVLAQEPPEPDNPLVIAKNCYITPHLAWATKEARQRLMNTVVNNVQSFLMGKPQNIVNG